MAERCFEGTGDIDGGEEGGDANGRMIRYDPNPRSGSDPPWKPQPRTLLHLSLG